jgi:hypothetical protein
MAPTHSLIVTALLYDMLSVHTSPTIAPSTNLLLMYITSHEHGGTSSEMA